MLNLFKRLLSGGSPNWQEIIIKNPLLIDVRTPAEFKAGHVAGALNIPLQDLVQKEALLDRTKPLIVYCASGMRSAAAANLLKKSGREVYNGGSMKALQKRLKK